MEEIIIEPEPQAYLFVIHGVPHDMRPRVAYRRVGKFAPERIKEIKCPYCGKLLTTVDESTKLELYRYPRRKTLPCHEYRKCHACHETVGIVFAPAP
jgi:phage FluMu protein Com